MKADLTWLGFIERVQDLGAQSLDPGFDREAHATRLATLSATLDLGDPTLAARFDRLERGLTGPYITEPVAKSETCGIMLVSLMAGGGVDLHEHPEQSGFILCIEGHLDVEAFDVMPQPPLRLRRVFNGSLGPGGSASLTPDRANVHGLHCPVATRLVDVFTPPLTDALRATCRRFSLVDECEPGVFSARLANTTRD